MFLIVTSHCCKDKAGSCLLLHDCNKLLLHFYKGTILFTKQSLMGQTPFKPFPPHFHDPGARKQNASISKHTLQTIHSKEIFSGPSRKGQKPTTNNEHFVDRLFSGFVHNFSPKIFRFFRSEVAPVRRVTSPPLDLDHLDNQQQFL